MARTKKTTSVADQPAEPKFTREQLINSKTLDLPKDAVSAVLEEGKAYSKSQAESLVTDFLERKV